MDFKEVIILDWYDNIITAFCKNESNVIYYCNLLAMDYKTNDKIYVCIDLKYFTKSELIKRIISNSTFIENEDVLEMALNMVNIKNESFLIKTDNLKAKDLRVVKYENDFNWNHNFFSIDYPCILDISSKIDNWWKYF